MTFFPIALLRTQLHLLHRWLSFTSSLLDFYASMQPVALRPVRMAKSTALVTLRDAAVRRDH